MNPVQSVPPYPLDEASTQGGDRGNRLLGLNSMSSFWKPVSDLGFATCRLGASSDRPRPSEPAPRPSQSNGKDLNPVCTQYGINPVSCHQGPPSLTRGSQPYSGASQALPFQAMLYKTTVTFCCF